jgi:hypothetical protein
MFLTFDVLPTTSGRSAPPSRVAKITGFSSGTSRSRGRRYEIGFEAVVRLSGSFVQSRPSPTPLPSRVRQPVLIASVGGHSAPVWSRAY